MTSRRGFLLGAAAFIASPAIVRAESLMKIAVLRDSIRRGGPIPWREVQALLLPGLQRVFAETPAHILEQRLFEAHAQHIS